MLASRAAPRYARVVLRTQARRNFAQTTRRFEASKVAPETPSGAGGASGAVTGGIVGGLVAFGVGYTWYSFSGAKTAVNSISSTKQYFESAFKKTTENVPEPNQAIKWLRQTANSYAAFIPGAQHYVDSAFGELESIQQSHGEQVDKIAKNAYEDLKRISKDEGASIEGVTKAWQVLQSAAREIGQLAGDVSQDILNNHPEIKEKFGGRIDELKRLGDQYGPEAKKKVDETWNQVQDALKNGVSVDSVNKIRQLVEDKVQEVRKLGDQAWDKGLEQAMPYLDKSPKVKEFVEQNKDKLKNSNLEELWNLVRDAAQKGDTSDLEKFAKEKAGQAKQSFGGGDLQKYLGFLPGGAEIGDKFETLQNIGEKHGQRAEQLLKEAFEEIKGVLEKKVKEGEKIANDAKKDAE